MPTTLLWILLSGLAMSLIALVGGAFVWLPERTLARWLVPMVSFAAGSLVGGALFHMLPHALASATPDHANLEWVAIGFTSFFALDQLLEWHHCHRPPGAHVRPLGPLLLAADGVHNLLGGLSVGAIFVTDLRAGASAWLAAALHELPQEIGDFGAIVQSGVSRRRALLYNFLSALTFPVGATTAWVLGRSVDVRFLVALGCGNFLYIAAADLLPEVKRAERLREVALRFAAFVLGLLLLYGARRLKP